MMNAHVKSHRKIHEFHDPDINFKIRHAISLAVYQFGNLTTTFDLFLASSVSLMQYDLELVFVKNSHVFVDEYLKKPEFIELMRRLGALGDGNQDQSKFQNPKVDLYC